MVNSYSVYICVMCFIKIRMNIFFTGPLDQQVAEGAIYPVKIMFHHHPHIRPNTLRSQTFQERTRKHFQFPVGSPCTKYLEEREVKQMLYK